MTMAVICPFSSNGSPVSGFKPYSGEDVDVVRSSFSFPPSASPPARRRVVPALLMGAIPVVRECLMLEFDVDGRGAAITRVVAVDIIMMVDRTAQSDVCVKRRRAIAIHRPNERSTEMPGNDEEVPDTTWNALLRWCEQEREREPERERESNGKEGCAAERRTERLTTETTRGRTDTHRSLSQQAKHDAEDAKDKSNIREFTAEERQWFYDAMASGLVDEVKKMKETVETLSAGGDPGRELTAEEVENREMLLEDLIVRVESVDNAGDLHTIGGLEPLVGTLRSPHASLRALAAEALATTTQNHIKAQTHALESGAMGALLRVAGEDSDDEARAKALYALSCLVRGCPDAQKAFALGGGVQIVTKLIAHDGAERVRCKALVLAKHVFTQGEANMAAAVEFGAIVKAAARLGSEDVNCREAASRVLLDIARCVDFEKYPKAVDDFRDPNTMARIADARATLAALKDEDDVAANTETKVALDALAAMFAP